MYGGGLRSGQVTPAQSSFGNWKHLHSFRVGNGYSFTNSSLHCLHPSSLYCAPWLPFKLPALAFVKRHVVPCVRPARHTYTTVSPHLLDALLTKQPSSTTVVIPSHVEVIQEEDTLGRVDDGAELNATQPNKLISEVHERE